MPLFYTLKCDECEHQQDVPQGAARPAAWLGCENLVFCSWQCLARFATGVVQELENPTVKDGATIAR